jgi:hypothetical protein
MRIRQEVGHEETFEEANLAQYTSRLVGRFLLSYCYGLLKLPQLDMAAKSI